MSTKDSINFVVGFCAITVCLGLLSIIGTYVYLTAVNLPVNAAFSNVMGQVLGVVTTLIGVALKTWIDKMPGTTPAPTQAPAPATPEKKVGPAS